MTDSRTTTKPRALILGATGGVGSAVVNELLSQGWHITALKRDVSDVSKTEGITWIQGDAMNQQDVITAAKDCQLIFHGVNPPGYQNWDSLVLPMLEHTLAAAKKVNATVVMPGNIYNFSKPTTGLITEQTPQQPLSKKGLIRVNLERSLRQHAANGHQVILLRCGDFIGETATSSFFTQGMLNRKHPTKKVTNISCFHAGHHWAYLPDVAKTLVKLILRKDELEAYADFNFRGYWDKSGTELAQNTAYAIERVFGHRPKITSFPWWVLSLAAPFHRLSRELVDVKPMWQVSLEMSNAKLIGVLGSEPHTPIREALTATITALTKKS